MEANGWDSLCEALIAKGALDGADAAGQQALALRQKSDARDLGFSEWLLGAVRLNQAEHVQQGPLRDQLLAAAAEDFTRKATGETRGPPAYRLAYQRGRILLAQRRVPEALQALEQAIDQAQRWRLGIAPALTSVDGAATQLQTVIFDGFVEAAADYSLQTRDQRGASRWAEESFEATELNRAINLRDSAQSTWRRAIPPEYWEILGQLQREEASVSRTRSTPSAISEHLRLTLTEMELKAGLGRSPNIAENFPSHTSLIHFQQSLRDSGILLSFALGARESWLWAVTRTTLHVYRLPPADQIVSTVRAFRQAVEARRAGFEDLGGQLYSMLFGQLRAQEASKPAWQLSAEDALLEVPFAALVLGRERPGQEHPESKQRSGRIVFLAEKHSLQVEAGAMLPSWLPPPSLSGFVSVGDPIYNVADPRWNSGSRWNPSGWWLSSGFGPDPAGQLSRLPGTRREVEASAAAWQGTSGGSSTAVLAPVVVLEGAAATRTHFLQAISSAPRVIHLATHALTAPSGEEAYLAFGLGRDGRPGC